MRPRILLDDHEIVRKGIRQLLDVPFLDVCGEASNGEEAVQKVLSLKPDLVLLDLSMPLMGGAEAMKQIRLCTRIRRDPHFRLLSVER
jgi:DNA-binding NarL/FixJ family response regulator